MRNTIHRIKIGSGVSKRLSVGRTRSAMAPAWRRIIRAVTVTVGLVLFAVLEVYIARAINANKGMLVAGILLGAIVAVIAMLRPLAGLMIWLIVSPTASRILNTQDVSSLPTITFDEAIIYILFLSIALRALYMREKIRKPTIGEVLLVLYTVFALVNARFCGRITGLNDIRGFMMAIGLCPIAFYVIMGAVRNKSDVVWLLRAFVMLGTLQGIAMIFEQITGNAYISLLYLQAIPLNWMGWSDVGVGRSVGMFASPVVASVLMPTAIYFAVHLAANTKSTYAKIAYYLTIPTIAVGSYFSFTRNVYLLLVIFILVMPFLLIRQRKQGIALAVIGILVAAIFVPAKLADDTQFYKRINDRGNIDLRIAYMRTAVNVIRDTPWFGVGWMNYMQAAQTHASSYAEWNTGSRRGRSVSFVHNAYLYTAAEQGLVGAMLYFGSWLCFLITIWRLRRKAKPTALLGKDFFSISLMFVVGLFIQSTTYSNHYAWYMNQLSFGIMAVAIRYGDILRSEEAEADSTTAPTELAPQS